MEDWFKELMRPNAWFKDVVPNVSSPNLSVDRMRY